MTTYRFDIVDIDGTLNVDGAATFNGAVSLLGALAFPTGSWTPSVGGNATYLLQEGKYVKIGRLVYITGQIQINTIGTGSTTRISGLPFTEGSGMGGTQAISIAYWSGIATNEIAVYGSVNSGSTNVEFYAKDSASGAVAGPIAIFQNSATVYFSGCYLAAS